MTAVVSLFVASLITWSNLAATSRTQGAVDLPDWFWDMFGSSNSSDSSNSSSSSSNSSSSSSTSCGDGTVQTGEQCDDGDQDTTNDCTNACKNAYCLDGILRTTGQGVEAEECDDGNETDDDECSTACKNARCGDGIKQAVMGETCDDGNAVDDDTCTNACKKRFKQDLKCIPNPESAVSLYWDHELGAVNITFYAYDSGGNYPSPEPNIFSLQATQYEWLMMNDQHCFVRCRCEINRDAENGGQCKDPDPEHPSGVTTLDSATCNNPVMYAGKSYQSVEDRELSLREELPLVVPASDYSMRAAEIALQRNIDDACKAKAEELCAGAAAIEYCKGNIPAAATTWTKATCEE